MSGIYAIRCISNGKMYIGQTNSKFNTRFNSHRCDLRKGRGLQKLQGDWNIYGEEDFEFLILEEGILKQNLNEREKYYIDLYDTINNGYNISAGGIGQGNFGRLNGMYGKHHTEKSKQLMSKNRKGLTCGKNNPNYGNHDNSKYTKEIRKKMSDAQKKRWSLRKSKG